MMFARISFSILSLALLCGCDVTRDRIVESVGNWNIIGPPVVATAVNVETYIQRCQAVMGPIPSFDCREGTRMPIFLNGKELTYSAGTYRLDGIPISPESAKVCDNPSFINPTKCEPNGRMGVKTSGPVNWLYFCRTSQPTEEKAPEYSYVNIIGNNPTTGETCFFETDQPGDGSHLPTPGRGSFWQIPSDSNACTKCHTANGPWIVTPHVAYARIWGTLGVDPIPLVPNRHIPGRAYRVIDIGGIFRRSAVETAVQPKFPNGGFDATCTQCHTISTGFLGSEIVPNSVGDPHSRWMPHLHGEMDSEAWEKTYGDSFSRLQYCLERDDSRLCAPRESVYSACPKPGIATKVTAAVRTVQLNADLPHEIQLTWTYDPAFGGVKTRDDVRFQIAITDDTGRRMDFKDIGRLLKGTSEWSFLHPAESQRHYAYEITAERYCYDGGGNTLGPTKNFELTTP